MADELPWFPFYVSRFLGSRKTRTMDAGQVGAYLLLLCEQWDHGPIPNDPDEIEDIARHGDAMAVLSKCFTLTDDGWVNEALEEIRGEQEAKSAARSRAGKRGAEKRWGKRKKWQPHGTAMPTHSIREEEIREEEKRITTARGDVEKSPARRKRGTQIPADWAPNETHAKRAKEDGTDLNREAEKFKAHHGAKGSTFIDWNKAFTTWLLNAKDFRRGSNAPPPDSEAAQWDAEAVKAKEARAAARSHAEREIQRLNTESLTAGLGTRTQTGSSPRDEAA